MAKRSRSPSAGDTHFEGGLRSQLDRNQNGMFAPIAPTLGGADLAMVNLETAIATGGSPDPKAYNFRAPPSAFEALRVAGVDVVTMANNHGRDFGPAGLTETLAAKAQTPLPVVGIGANAEEAYRPWRTELKGQRIAVFAATDVLDDWLIEPWTATDAQAGLASTKDTSVDRLLAGIRGARVRMPTRSSCTCTGASRDRRVLLLASRSSRNSSSTRVATSSSGATSHRVMTGRPPSGPRSSTTDSATSRSITRAAHPASQAC